MQLDTSGQSPRLEKFCSEVIRNLHLGICRFTLDGCSASFHQILPEALSLTYVVAEYCCTCSVSALQYLRDLQCSKISFNFLYRFS